MADLWFALAGGDISVLCHPHLTHILPANELLHSTASRSSQDRAGHGSQQPTMLPVLPIPPPPPPRARTSRPRASCSRWAGWPRRALGPCHSHPAGCTEEGANLTRHMHTLPFPSHPNPPPTPPTSICSGVQESRLTDFTREMCTPRLRWMPAQRMHRNTPRFHEAQRGPAQGGV